MEFDSFARCAPLPKFEVETMHRQYYTHEDSPYTRKRNFYNIVNSPPRTSTGHGSASCRALHRSFGILRHGTHD